MRTAHSSYALGTLAAMLAVAGLGCGASYQAVYEGEVRFEHCYRLDLESRMPLTQRRECWREWTEFYTYGQTRDRIEYASRRLRELSEQIRDPTGASLPESGAPKPPPAVIAPAPTNPFEPPPAIHTEDAGMAADGAEAGPSDASAEAAAAKMPPGQSCITACAGSWNGCTEACKGDKLKTCRTTCDIRFRSCVARCL